jgi:hypothetical protein
MTEARERWWGLADRLNRALYPHLGPAQLGSSDEPPPAPSAGRPCPLCGASMRDHVVERAGERDWTTASRLHCPDVRGVA